jgi:hypothetical protein
VHEGGRRGCIRGSLPRPGPPLLCDVDRARGGAPAAGTRLQLPRPCDLVLRWRRGDGGSFYARVIGQEVVERYVCEGFETARAASPDRGAAKRMQSPPWSLGVQQRIRGAVAASCGSGAAGKCSASVCCRRCELSGGSNNRFCSQKRVLCSTGGSTARQ